VGRAVAKREINVSDLTQLSRVNQEMERKLKGMGYNLLWDIAYANINQLAEDARISIRTAKRMIDEARNLVVSEEDEEQ
jgi:hypothetical protein